MTLRAVFYDGTGFSRKEVGSATLVGERVVLEGVIDDLSFVKVIEPETFKILKPTDGERYVRALPAAFRGTYCWAELVEDE